MILAAGLTPAWQQVLVFDSFRFGEVNRAREVHWCASGKVLNAGIALHLLGGPSMTLAPLGGLNLVPIEREFKGKNIDHRWIVTQAATRVCTTIIDRGSGKITELVENGQPLTADELAEFRRAYVEEAAKAEVAILIGSLPVGTPDSYYRELAALTPCPAILDFRGEGLLSCLDLRPLVVKPNREELAKTFGRPLDGEGDLRAAMEEVARRGARWVVVSQGKEGALALGEGKFLRFRPPAVEALNPIGSGDSMAAGIACSIVQGADMVEAIRTGIAAGAENATTLLPADIEGSLALRLRPQVTVEEA